MISLEKFKLGAHRPFPLRSSPPRSCPSALGWPDASYIPSVKTDYNHNIDCEETTYKMNLLSLLLSSFLLILPATAQFGNIFEQMFQGGGGQQQHQQAPQNAGSDAAWYQQNYENGIAIPYSRDTPGTRA